MNISSKDKKLMLIFGMFLVVVLYYNFFLKNQLLVISQLKQKNNELLGQKAAAESTARSYNGNADKRYGLQSDYITVSGRIPPNQDEKFSILDAYNLSQALKTNLGDFVISKREPVEFTLDKKKIDKAYSYTLNLNWALTYENFKKLLSYSNEYDEAYSIGDLTAVPDSTGVINTNFELKLYGFDDSNAPSRIWTNPDIDIGKYNLFSQSAASTGDKTPENDMAGYMDKNKDFLVLLSTLNSPTSAVTVEKTGKGIDIFGSGQSVENVDINLEGTGGKYSYSMSAGPNTYPKDGGYEEFNPISQNIVIFAASEPRKYADDKNMAILNVHNHTDKKVYVYISNDDRSLPRAAVVKDGSSIYIYGK